jgi:CBS domain-containing protein
MTVRDVMTSNVTSCRTDTDLATAAMMMWDHDCGIVPVVNDENGNVVGVITDRDICIATASRRTSPQNLSVREVMTGQLYYCRADDDILGALGTMRGRRVRRLPVLDAQQRLVGILSMNDLVEQAEHRRGANIAGEQVLDTLKSICARATTSASA